MKINIVIAGINHCRLITLASVGGDKWAKTYFKKERLKRHVASDSVVCHSRWKPESNITALVVRESLATKRVKYHSPLADERIIFWPNPSAAGHRRLVRRSTQLGERRSRFRLLPATAHARGHRSAQRHQSARRRLAPLLAPLRPPLGERSVTRRALSCEGGSSFRVVRAHLAANQSTGTAWFRAVRRARVSINSRPG